MYILNWEVNPMDDKGILKENTGYAPSSSGSISGTWTQGGSGDGDYEPDSSPSREPEDEREM